MGACALCTDDAKEDEARTPLRGPTPHDRRKDGKVVIVGAGPAGIHMYSLLVKAGWNGDNITLLEKQNRICGKSYTLQDKGMGPNDDLGIVHEMGTCYNHPDYHVLFDLFKEYDPDNILKGIPSRGAFGTELNEDHDKPHEQKHVEFTDWLLAKAEEHAVPEAFHFLNDKITGGLAFVDAVIRYCKIWEEIFGEQEQPKRYGMPGKPNKEQMKRIDCSFLEFIQNEGVEALIPFFVYSQTVQGYGTLDTIPAYYGLYWNNPQLVQSPVWTSIKDEPGVIVVSKGFQSLWEQMFKKHKMNVVKNAQIQSVNRYLDSKEQQKIKICYQVKRADDYEFFKHPEVPDPELKQDESVQEIECDYLFLACGCKKALGFLDATEQEKEIFGVLKPHVFTCSVVESATDTDQLHERVSEFWPNIQWKANGKLGAFRNSIKCWLDHEKYDKMVKDGKITKDRSCAYQFMNREPNPDKKADHKFFTDLLMEGLEKWGEKETKIIFQLVWDYMPIWSHQEVVKGYPWIVRNEMQGKFNNTFYIGSSVSYESVLNVVEYNNEIFDKYKF
eukprot:232238_1